MSVSNNVRSRCGAEKNDDKIRLRILLSGFFGSLDGLLLRANFASGMNGRKCLIRVIALCDRLQHAQKRARVLARVRVNARVLYLKMLKAFFFGYLAADILKAEKCFIFWLSNKTIIL